MILKPFYLACLSHASYLLGDERTKTAVVVDPQRDIEPYLAEAQRLGLTIRHTMLTHFHADFVAGHLELRDRCGATIHLGARGKADYAFSPLRDGSLLEFGSLGIGALETPGHTPEGVTLLVYDLDASREKPVAALTGDTLFIGDVGRPDLMASAGVAAEDLAGMLFDSLHDKILRLPDETKVYPAHGAGSMCGRALSDEKVSTIGEQKLYNYALKPRTKAEFVKMATTDLPDAPAYFSHDADMNKRERDTLDSTLARALKPLAVAAVEERLRAGALLLDARAPGDFASAHWKGSVNVGLDGKFATWAGTVLDKSRPLVVLAEPGREREAIVRLGRIGFDRVEGYLDGGMGALASRPELVGSFQRVTARALSELLAAPNAPLVVDVRTDGERAGGAVNGSLHIPLSQWPKRMAEVPTGKPVVLHCAGGYRSMIAASLLRASGRSEVTDLVGGWAAWEEEKLPVAKAEKAS